MSDNMWLKEKLEKIENKLDSVQDKQAEMNITLVRQENNIATHIKRTDLAEENIILLRTDMKPIQAHIDMIHGAFKVIGAFTTIVGLGTAIVKFFQIFHS